MSDQLIKIGSILFATAFVITSVSLLIVGLNCTFGKSTLKLSASECENIYASGLILTAIVIALASFVLVERVYDCLEKGRRAGPRQQTQSKQPTQSTQAIQSKGIESGQSKQSGQKMKKSPLSTIAIKN